MAMESTIVALCTEVHCYLPARDTRLCASSGRGQLMAELVARSSFSSTPVNESRALRFYILASRILQFER